jgi:hypothetical protein
LISLRDYKGRVPVLTGHPSSPVLLVDFPTMEEFSILYGNRVTALNRQRYYRLLVARSNGATLADAGQLAGVTRERVRQVESKFLRLMRQKLLASTKPSL